MYLEVKGIMMNKSEFVKQKAGFFFNLISAAAFLMVLSVVSQIMVMLFGEYLPSWVWLALWCFW